MSDIPGGMPWNVWEGGAPSALFSLYLQLSEGAKADLEVVARTSLALAATAREFAYVFDPSLAVKIELVGSRDGSLWLDTKLRAVGILSPTQALSVGIVAGSLAVCFVNNFAATAIQDLIHEYLWSAPSSPPFTQQMMDEAVRKAVENVNCGVAKPQAQAVYRALDQDPNIVGVAAAKSKHEKPTNIVPRDQFVIRSGSTAQPLPAGERRSFDKRLMVTLVKPVLRDEDKSRSWTISINNREYGALMRDRKFAHDVAVGLVSIKLEGGIQLDILLQHKEEYRDGAWRTYERNIKEVYGVYPPGQGSLPLPR